MCKPKPGKRCAADTRKAHDRLVAAITTATANNDTKALSEALDAMERNRLDWASTREGAAELDHQITVAEAQNNRRQQDILRARKVAAQQLVDMRQHAVELVADADHLPDDARKLYAELVENELYEQALRTNALIPYDGDGHGAPHTSKRLEAAEGRRRLFARRADLPDYPEQALPNTRCPDCGGYTQRGLHNCTGPDTTNYAAFSDSTFHMATGHVRRYGTWSSGVADRIVADHHDAIARMGHTDAEVREWINSAGEQAMDDELHPATVQRRMDESRALSATCINDIASLPAEEQDAAAAAMRATITPKGWTRLTPTAKRVLLPKAQVGSQYFAVPHPTRGGELRATPYGAPGELAVCVDPVNPTDTSLRKHGGVVFTSRKDAQLYANSLPYDERGRGVQRVLYVGHGSFADPTEKVDVAGTPMDRDEIQTALSLEGMLPNTHPADKVAAMKEALATHWQVHQPRDSTDTVA